MLGFNVIVNSTIVAIGSLSSLIKMVITMVQLIMKKLR